MLQDFLNLSGCTLSPQLLLLLGNGQPCLDHGVRYQTDRVDAALDQKGGEFGKITGRLPADADLPAPSLVNGDHLLDQGLDRLIPFIEDMADQIAVPIQAQGELGEVVGADGEAVEDIGNRSATMTLLGISHMT